MQPATYRVIEHEGAPLICVFFTPDLYEQVAKDLEFTRKKKEQNRAYARTHYQSEGPKITRGSRPKPIAKLCEVDLTPGATGVAVKLI